MVKEIKEKEQELYQCEECGFRYKERVNAEECESWCKEHHTCNIEITKHSIENQK